MLDERKLAVLRAIIEDFVRTHEPVGSRALVDRHNLGVSPATIRNDMAVLEDEGYIAQPHTSAGRVPTDLGYRLFVDRLTQVKPLSNAERRAIEAFLTGAVDLDDVMGRAVRLLSQMTRQVALVQYPSLSYSAVRHIELISLGERRLLMVLISSTGRVDQRIMEIPVSLSESDLDLVRTRLNEAAAGLPFPQVAQRVAGFGETFPAELRPVVATIVACLLETAVDRHEERIVMGGTSNLARHVDAFAALAPVLEALEEQVVLLRLLGEVSADAVTVRIGRENPVEGLTGTSVVTTGYGSGSATVARLGVVGPTHMDYPSTIAAVRAVARYLGQILGTDQTTR